MNVSASNATAIQSTRQPTQLQKENAERPTEAQEQPKPVEAKQPTPTTPVINTQGHTTGRLVNVTA
ncbi:MAG: hypothetical protein GW928_09365 [Rhodoferax sp.]|nr:hypothetical protein [Betaproteobacteria bacterium]NCN97628.1 hypothetical protein [Rhodoferax sp.]OIP15835.1 MAG: hypothetical protein AUK50_10150 [Comamonadaceae bacterium CG2_30_57_122]PIZ23413.1 MAG: hypothetical protein COY49_03535 [Comamonadaceae bacterium CG_4_10_14_0_8_um_filter_57_29]PJC22808.1 MAG: hypothetical protein CO065_00870 [Comamonadaceae bacterium CG_4_9_14_0_8_um_filter_57_21]